MLLYPCNYYLFSVGAVNQDNIDETIIDSINRLMSLTSDSAQNLRKIYQEIQNGNEDLQHVLGLIKKNTDDLKNGLVRIFNLLINRVSEEILKIRQCQQKQADDSNYNYRNILQNIKKNTKLIEQNQTIYIAIYDKLDQLEKQMHHIFNHFNNINQKFDQLSQSINNQQQSNNKSNNKPEYNQLNNKPEYSQPNNQSNYTQANDKTEYNQEKHNRASSDNSTYHNLQRNQSIIVASSHKNDTDSNKE